MPSGIALDHAGLVGVHLVEVDGDGLGDDAERVEIRLRLVQHLRRVEHRLRRNAADVEAGAAEGAATLHTGGFQAKLGGADGADIAAGAAADHDEVIVGHAGPPYFELF